MLGYRDGDVLMVSRRVGPTMSRAPLLDGDGELLPKPKAIFEQWFYDFAVCVLPYVYCVYTNVPSFFFFFFARDVTSA